MVLQRADMDVGVVEEGVVCEHFKDPSYTDSFYFCYLLIDPRGLDIDNLDLDAFLRAIFYVGKGKHQRCQFHFDEAIASRRGGKRSDKTERICEVWDAGHGVLVPHLFSNIHSDEAFVREAAMIAALGESSLALHSVLLILRTEKPDQRPERRLETAGQALGPAESGELWRAPSPQGSADCGRGALQATVRT